MGGGGGQRAGLARCTNTITVGNSIRILLRKYHGATGEESSNSPGITGDCSLEEVVFEMGFEGWEHMAETQEQFLAEGKSLGKKRRAGSSRWGGVRFKQSFSYLTPRAVVLGIRGTAPSGLV